MSKKLMMMLIATTAVAISAGLSKQNPAPLPNKDQPRLRATLSPTEGSQVTGDVIFQEEKDGTINVAIHLTGLEPNSIHAIHIHEFGDISAKDGSSAGDHFNPGDKPHGLPPDDNRHAGDLGNITADSQGTVSKAMKVENISLVGEEDSVLGRAVIVHAQRDMGSQPTGDAGPRIAVAVIGFKESQ